MTELSLPNNLPVVNPSYDDKALASVSTNSEWLPRLQVMGSSTELVKEGKCPIGIFALIDGQKCTQLPKEIDVLVVSWRPMALRIQDGTPLSYFKPSSETFQEVKRIADSGAQMTGCMYGPQFLLWVPSHQTFATFFTGSQSARREAPTIVQIIKPEGATEYKPAMATLEVNYIKGKKNSWHNYLCKRCSTPPSSMPDEQVFIDEVTKFNNPVDSQIEAAAQTEQRAR